MPNFFGGLAAGLQAGDLNGSVDYILKKKQEAKVAQALSAWASSQDNHPPQAGPGGPPQPQPHPAAALAALGGGGAPQVAPRPAPPPTQAPVDPLAPLPAGAPSAGGPPPQAGPMPQPGPDPNLSATAQPDQQFGDPIKEAQQSLGAMIRSIKAANPDIKPRVLMDAVHSQLDDMKGILPMTKAVMQGQVQLLKSQMDIKFKYDKLNAENERFAEKMQDLVKRHADLAAFDAAREEHMKRMDDINQSREQDYGRSVDYQHEDRGAAEQGRDARASQAETGRNSRAAQSDATKRDISGQRSRDSTYRSKQSFRGAQVRGGGIPDPEPAAPDGGAPAPGAGGIPANVQQFAKQHGLTVIRKRADGKYDAKAKDGTVGVIG